MEIRSLITIDRMGYYYDARLNENLEFKKRFKVLDPEDPELYEGEIKTRIGKVRVRFVLNYVSGFQNIYINKYFGVDNHYWSMEVINISNRELDLIMEELLLPDLEKDRFLSPEYKK